MRGTLSAEALVAMTGIFPTRKPSELQVRGALSYGDRLRRRLARFFAAEKAERIIWERPPAQEDLWKDINGEHSIDDLTEWLDGLPDDMTASYAIIISAAREQLKNAWPIYQDTSLGTHNFELAPDEYGDVWHLTRTLNDPETIFDDLDALALLPSQVEALVAVYPDIHETIVNLTMLALQPYMAVDGMLKRKKSLAFEREEQIRVLLRLPLDAPFESPPQPQQKKPQEPQTSTNDRRVATQSERVADKEGAA